MYDKDLKLEWDKNKRQRTIVERRLDFADLKEFDWHDSLIREDKRKDYGESRFVSMGYLAGRIVVVGWCRRAAAIRIFSLRKANKREVRGYEQAADRG